MLNGRPYLLKLVLDQGYWPDTLLAAPSDDALRRDVELAKAMGFNGVRKHQKIEDPRYLYWADRLGLMVWEEMPSAYRFTRSAIKRTVREWTEVIERDYSHPCVIVWVPFNESWGVPELPAIGKQRHAVEALYHLTKTLDATRPVIGNDGWESSATDIIGIHDYDANIEHLRQRYGAEIKPEQLFDRRRPGGRILTLDGYPHRGQPIMLTEFGGIAFAKCPQDGVRQTWGYTVAKDNDEFARMLADLIYAVIHHAPLQRILLHAIRRYFPGSKRTALCGPHAENPDRRYRQDNAHLPHAHPGGRVMYALDFTKPDGRQLTLYSQRPIDSRISAPSPFAEPLNASPHLRLAPPAGRMGHLRSIPARTHLPAPPGIQPAGGNGRSRPSDGGARWRLGRGCI